MARPTEAEAAPHLAPSPPAPSPPVTAPAEPVPPPPRIPERRHEWIHVFIVGLVAGIVVAAGLLALELVAPGGLPTEEVELRAQSFPGLGFAVSHPVGWTVESSPVEALDAVSFTDPRRQDGASRRGFRVVADSVPLERVRNEVEELFRRKRADYRKITITDGLELAGEQALRHIFRDGGLIFEQWWVPREGGTFRIEFWAPASEQEVANAENGRILETFQVV